MDNKKLTDKEQEKILEGVRLSAQGPMVGRDDEDEEEIYPWEDDDDEDDDEDNSTTLKLQAKADELYRKLTLIPTGVRVAMLIAVAVLSFWIDWNFTLPFLRGE